VDVVCNLGRDGFNGFENTIDVLENEGFARAANQMQYRDGNGIPYIPWE
jgi:hypothetical protein